MTLSPAQERAMELLAWQEDNDFRLSQVQGFHYGEDNVVRDCWLPPDQQELWRSKIDEDGASWSEMISFIESYKLAMGLEACGLLPDSERVKELEVVLRQVTSSLGTTITERDEALVREQVLREALEWYGENARLARLIHDEGDPGRHKLAHDGGEKARQALTSTQPEAEAHNAKIRLAALEEVRHEVRSHQNLEWGEDDGASYIRGYNEAVENILEDISGLMDEEKV
ncbi:MAG: hypothetical protein ACE37E_01025 [Hyphomicrobiales bacterium]